MESGTLKTSDGQKIAFDHYPHASSKVIILAHGFYNNKDAYLFKHIAQALAKEYAVISFDFRGHGKSSGLFSWTAKEDRDLTTVLDYAKEKNYQKIGVMGFSLGAAVALAVAGKDKRIDSVIAVSAPISFWDINFHFWEPEMLNDLKLNLGMKGKGKGLRPGNLFLKKVKPIDVVDKISSTPVYFIHGSDDWIIKPKHSQKLFAKAKEPKKLLIINGTGHAEKIFDAQPDEFIKECLAWFKKTL